MTEKRAFICQECGYTHPQWLGKCPNCGNWGTMVEEVSSFKRVKPKEQLRSYVLQGEDFEEQRIKTSFEEFNRVLGGGIVEGSVILLGGAPGMGKSTLVLQILDDLASQGVKVLYCSSEESVNQIRSKLKRLGGKSSGFLGLSTPYVDDLLEEFENHKPQLIVLDSLQASSVREIVSPPGSIVQVREVASRLIKLAKGEGVSVIIIGHITKEGVIAGPKLIEHLVDVVLYFEQREESPFRILRAVKNRFGSTNEIGVFEMTERGLKEVKNPSEIFLAERPQGVPGSVVMPAIEGTRPLLVEVQALVAPSYGSWRRTAMGIDYNRLLLLVGVIEKRMGLDLSHRDIFLNVVGGLWIEEPAVDLAVITAIASSHLDKVFPPDTIVFGEVGLAGEIRSALYAKERLEEAKRLGFKRAIIPKANLKSLKMDMELFGIREIREILSFLERKDLSS